MADAKFKQAAKKLKDTLARKYETAQTVQKAGAIGSGKLQIGGQIYDGTIDGVTAVVNTGRLAAATYAPKVGGGVSVSSSGGSSSSSSSTGTGSYLPLDGSVAMTGDLNMGNNDITNVATVDGRDVAADGALLDGLKAAPVLVVGSADANFTNERVLAFSTAFSASDGGAGSNYVVSLATPGTLTVDSANSADGNHVHAITTSSNPGAQKVILNSDTDGSLTLTVLYTTTKVQTPLIDTSGSVDLTIQPGGDLILSPGDNNVTVTSSVRVGSDNYASQTTGWAVDYNGAGDFRYLYADEMHVRAFIADVEQALAGLQIIAKSVAILYAAFTAPAAGGSTTLVVRDLPSATGMAVFQDNDIVGVREFSRAAGSFSASNCWGAVVLDITYGVSGFDSSTKTQRYTFTRSVDPNAGAMTAGNVVEPDAVILDYGIDGNGFYEVNAVDGLYAANSPYSQIVTWTGHPATGKTVKVRLGNLAGITDTDLNPTGYGLYSGNAFLKGDLVTANGVVRIHNDSGINIEEDAWDNWDSKRALQWWPDIDDMSGDPSLSLYSSVVVGGITDGQNFAYIDANPTGNILAGLSVTAYGQGTGTDATVYLEGGSQSLGTTSSVNIAADEISLAGSVVFSGTGNAQHFLPRSDVTYDLGSAVLRWDTLYVGQIIAGFISGGSLGGAEWEYSGSMVIDANSASDTQVDVVNQGDGNVTFNVVGSLTVSGTAVSLVGHTHSEYLNVNGDTIVGNITVADTVTIDGVDISAHAADVNAHHNRSHSITSASDHTVTGATLDLVGLTSTNTLGIITPSSAPGAASAVLKTDSGGTLAIPQLTATTKVRTPLIDTASGNLSIAPAGGTTAITGALTVSSTAVFDGQISTPTVATVSGDLTLAPASGLVNVTSNLSVATLATVGTQVTTPKITSSIGDFTVAAGSRILLSPIGDQIIVSSAATLKADDYQSQLTAWQITYDGAADFRYIYADEMRIKLFMADLQQVIAGSELVTKSISTVSRDFIVPYPGSAATLYVDDLPSAVAMAVFESGDYVLLRSQSRVAGYMLLSDCWGTVTSHNNEGSKEQSWTFTRSGTATISTISQRGTRTTSSSSAATSRTVTKVSGTTSGDYMVALVVLENINAAVTTLPGGWELLGSGVVTGVQAYLYGKVAGGSEPANYTWQWDTSTACYVSLHCYRNVHNDYPYSPVEVTLQDAAITSLPGSSVQALSEGDMFLIFAGLAGNVRSTEASGTTERTDAGVENIGAYAAEEKLSASGETGAYSPTPASSVTSVVFTLTLLPAYSEGLTTASGQMTPGTTYEAGGFAVDFGISGNGWVETSAVDGQYGENSPYVRIASWTTHPATGAVVRTQMGNLYGITAVSGEYGLYAGDGGIAAGNQYLRVSTAGVQLNNVPIKLYNAGTQTVNIDNAGVDIWIGPSSGDKRLTFNGATFALNKVDIALYNGATQTVNISSTGQDIWVGPSSGDKRLSWNGTTLSVVGAITVSSGSSGIASFSDANLDNIADGTTYGRLDKTIIAGGLIQVGSGTKDSDLSGWHLSSTEIVGQSSGADKVVLATDGTISVIGEGTFQIKQDASTLKGYIYSSNPLDSILIAGSGIGIKTTATVAVEAISLRANSTSGRSTEFAIESAAAGSVKAIVYTGNFATSGQMTLTSDSFALALNGTSTTDFSVDSSGNVLVNGGIGIGTAAGGSWTSSGWTKALVFASQGMTLLWNKGASGVARGIGVSSDGVLYITRSTANDNSAAPTYDMTVGTTGGVTISPAAGTNALTLTTPASQTAAMFAISSADNGNSYGPFVYIGRNTNGSTPATGFIQVINRAGTSYNLWPDASGNLRIGTTTPTNAQDSSGTVVGTQTSSLDSKVVLGATCTPDEALQHVLEAASTALRRFRYKSGAFNDEEFEGIVTDYAPRYGMDRDSDHPAGKSLNTIQIVNDLILSIKELANQNEALSSRLAALEHSQR